MRGLIAPIVIGTLGLVAASSSAKGQVGYPPSRSPYVDLEHSQEFTIIAGEYHAHRDAANVGPQSGLITGIHYEWRAGGPAHIVTEIARIESDRRVLNPFRSGTARELGTFQRPLYAANIGLGLSLTGAKSWHNFVPEVGAGLGFVSDLRSAADSGGFRFGTRFALDWGGGIRYLTGGRWQIRGDIKNRLYKLAYPQTFYESPSTGGGGPIVSSSQSQSFWLNNPAFTLGLSYLF